MSLIQPPGAYTEPHSVRLSADLCSIFLLSAGMQVFNNVGLKDYIEFRAMDPNQWT